MGKKINQLAVTAAVVGAAAVATAGSAQAGEVESQLADVTQVSLADLEASDDSVLANSIRQVVKETASGRGFVTNFNSVSKT